MPRGEKPTALGGEGTGGFGAVDMKKQTLKAKIERHR
jgi:hypothetical protein